MKNTGIMYQSAERKPVILPEMAELLPPLTEDQLSTLESDLLANGCYSPVIVNQDMVIIDGHNRACPKTGERKRGKKVRHDVSECGILMFRKHRQYGTQKGEHHVLQQ